MAPAEAGRQGRTDVRSHDARGLGSVDMKFLDKVASIVCPTPEKKCTGAICRSTRVTTRARAK